MTSGDEVVRAGGGVVWRQNGNGDAEVLVVHRPKYDDWTFPKGKLDAGEDEADAALREVQEETGLRCQLGPELESTSYRDAQGRPKVVRYWAMSALEGEFRPNAEVDEAKWVTPAKAARILSYDRDRAVLATLPV